MYTNNNDGNSKQQTRTKLTDMGVVVIDEEHSSNETYSSNEIIGKSESAQQSNQDEPKQSLLNEGDAPVDMTLVTAKEKNGRFKRVLIAGGVTLGLLCLLFGAAYFWLSSGSRQSEEHKVTANNSSSNKANEQPQSITVEEISQELNKHTAESNNASEQTSTNQIGGSSSSSPITDKLPNEDLSATVNSNDVANRSVNNVAANSLSQSTSSSNNSASSAASTNNSSSTVSLSQENASFVPTRSIRVSALQKDKTEEGKSNDKPQSASKIISTQTGDVSTRKINSIVLPPFGTMLPVRTVGTVFTLRSDSYIRLQLTRDVSGQGWALKRGTEFYGTVRGAELETERAFISIVGFIASNTNRFVRLQGSVMGSDGADGVRGKKHKLNSGWVNALKKVGAEVLDTAKSAATGIGRRPIIITDTSPRMIDPIAEEISGLVINKNGFVEVPAGTPCYVSVTTLPNEVQGVDAVGDVTSFNANVSSFNSNQSRNQNGLSEQELAYLLTGGDKEETRLALLRMSPQMRRVAEAFLVNK